MSSSSPPIERSPIVDGLALKAGDVIAGKYRVDRVLGAGVHATVVYCMKN